MFIHKDSGLEEKFAKDGSQSDPNSATSPESKCVLQTITNSVGVDAGTPCPRCWLCIVLTLTWSCADGTDHIIDDGGVANLQGQVIRGEVRYVWPFRPHQHH